MAGCLLMIRYVFQNFFFSMELCNAREIALKVSHFQVGMFYDETKEFF